MTEPSFTKIPSSKSHPKNYKEKRMLYELLYDLKSVIQGKPVEINHEEFEENVLSTSIAQIISYLKDFIPILIKSLKKEYSKTHHSPPSSLPEPSAIEKYQNRLLKLEQKERKYIKHILQHRLIKESLEMRISEYIQMEEDFEEMKLKFRYEEGKFLSNDRKDNEIIILRSENSNLKTEITTLEQNIKKLQNEIIDYKLKLNNQTKMNNELKQLLDEKQKELNYISNININIHNSPHSMRGGTLTNNSNHANNTTSYIYNSNTHHNDLSSNERANSSEPKSNNDKKTKEIIYYSQLQHQIIKNRFNSDGSKKLSRNGSTGKRKIDFVSQFNSGSTRRHLSNHISINDSQKLRLKGNKSAANLMDLTQYPMINKGGFIQFKNIKNHKNFSGLGMLRKNFDK